VSKASCRGGIKEEGQPVKGTVLKPLKKREDPLTHPQVTNTDTPGEKQHSEVHDDLKSHQKETSKRRRSQPHPVLNAKQNTAFNPANLTDATLCIDEFNKRYAVVNGGNKIVVVDDYADSTSSASRMTKHTFFDLYANKTVSKGKATIGAAQYWFEHALRRQYLGGFVFDPARNTQPEKYNLWKGFAVQPDPKKSCQRLLDHLLEVICDGNQDCFEYLINWLALLIQKPHQLPGVAICLLSEQGAGKGIALSYIGTLLGRHYKTITSKTHLVGQFTGQLEDAVLVFADELHWEGSKADTGILKGLITEKTRMMERKYSEAIAVNNCVHLVVASNESWAIPAELGDRRFFVLQASSVKKGDETYFNNIAAEMVNGGPEALLAHLQSRNISSFSPGKFPKTAARVSQQLASLDPIETWLYKIADSGSLSSIQNAGAGTWPDKINKHGFHQSYTQWHNQARTTGKPEGISAFTTALKKFGLQPCKMPIDDCGARPPGYALPSVEGLRKAIDEALGHPAPWDPN